MTSFAHTGRTFEKVVFKRNVWNLILYFLPQTAHRYHWAFFFWDSRVDWSDSRSSTCKTRKVLTRVGLGSISIPTLHRAGVHHSEPLVVTAIAAKALGKWTRGSERGLTRELTCRHRRSISGIIWEIYHKKELTLVGLP